MRRLLHVVRRPLRALGGAHPFTEDIERNLRVARAALASEGDDVSALREALDAMTVRKK